MFPHGRNFLHMLCSEHTHALIREQPAVVSGALPPGCSACPVKGQLRRYFPQLPKSLTVNQKRAFLKERGIDRPVNVALADLPMIALDRETIDNAFSTCALKLFCSLYYKHVGKIVPRTGGVFARWFMNIDVYQGAIPDEFVALLRGHPTLHRANVNLKSQFTYRYAVSEDAKHAFYDCAFRNSFKMIGFVCVDSSYFDDPTEQLLRPFNWPA
jgi:hypothetical protein